MTLPIKKSRLQQLSYQGFKRGREDCDVNRVEVCLLDIHHTLHVNIQDTNQVLSLDILHCRFAGETTMQYMSRKVTLNSNTVFTAQIFKK